MPASAERTKEDVRSNVEAWLATQVPGTSGLTVSELRDTAGGLSSEMYFCTVSWNEGDNEVSRKMVMRVRPDHHQVIPDPDVVFQYELMRGLGEKSSVPVPRTWLAEPTGDVIGSPFFLMEQVKGTLFSPVHPSPADPADTDAPAWGASEIAKLYDNGLEVLASLHKVDARDGFEFVGKPGKTALDGALAQSERWYTWAGRGRKLGVIDKAREWLFANKPDTEDVSINWGDARPGNMLVDDDLNIVAVLDWEMAILGPPEVDLGWWLLFERAAFEGFGLPKPAGVPNREETIATYEKLLGRPVNDIRYFEIFAGYRLAIINIRLLELGAYGPNLQSGWLIENNDEQMILNDPFTRILAEWMSMDVHGNPLPKGA